MDKQTVDKVRGLLTIGAASLLVSCTTPVQQNVVQSSPAPERIDILFVGDTSHGESYHAQYEADGKGNIIKEKGYDYSFAKLKPILDAADYTIVNVETPLTSLREPPWPEKGYNHWSDPVPATTAYVRHGFDAVSLANNHTVDYGVDGLTETLAALDMAGIAYFGAGMNKQDANAPLRKSFAIGQCTVDMTVFGRFEYRQSYHDKYDFYASADTAGAAALHLDELLGEIEAEKTKNPNSFVVIYPHWGENYRWRSELQETQAKAMVKAGADLILGHGAHTLGEVTAIKEAYIVYSLGNFVFNTWGRFPDNPEVLPMSFVSRITMSETKGGPAAKLSLYPIFSDNRIVNYQPRFVTELEFRKALEVLEQKTGKDFSAAASKDEFGWSIKIDLAPPNCREDNQR